LQKRPIKEAIGYRSLFADETYNLIDPTNQSHSLPRFSRYCDSFVWITTWIDDCIEMHNMHGRVYFVCMKCAQKSAQHMILCARIRIEDCVEMSDMDWRNIRFAWKRLSRDGLKNVFWMNQNMEISSWHVKNPTVLWFFWIRRWIEGCTQISIAGWILCEYLQISSWRVQNSHRSVIVWKRTWIGEHICDSRCEDMLAYISVCRHTQWMCEMDRRIYLYLRVNIHRRHVYLYLGINDMCVYVDTEMFWDASVTRNTELKCICVWEYTIDMSL